MKKSFKFAVLIMAAAFCVSLVSCGNKENNEKVYVPISPEHFEDNGTDTTSVEVVFKVPFVRTIANEIKERPADSRFITSSPGSDNTSCGYFVKPVKGKTLQMYSWPSKDYGKVKGTFSDNQTGVVLYTYYLDIPIPMTDVYVLVRNLDTGIEGWVYYEFYEESNLLFTTDTYETKEVYEYELVNASVTQKSENLEIKEGKYEISNDGTKYAVLSWNNIEVYNIGETEPVVVIDGTKFTPSLTKDTVFKFSSDGENLYILQERGDLFNFNFEEGATTKICKFNFEEQDGTFKNPKRLAVSSDSRFFYVVAEMSKYSRSVPRLLVYDAVKEKLHYFDIRGSKDSQDGYYYYSGIQFTPEGEALICMDYAEHLAVRFYVNEEDELAYSVTEFNDRNVRDIIYSDDYKSFICIKQNPGRMEKVSFDGNVIEESRKYIFDPFPDKTKIGTEIIPNYKKGLFAVVLNNYENNQASVYVYSLKTLNLLYSFYSSDYRSGNYAAFNADWIDNNIYVSWGNKGRMFIYTLDIREKDNQMSLVYDWDERIDHLCAEKSNIDSYEGLALYVNFTSQGFYFLESKDMMDFDDIRLAWADGTAEFINDVDVRLHEVGNGIGDAWEDGEEAVEKRKKLLRNIPVLEKDGTVTMKVVEYNEAYGKDTVTNGFKVICDYYGK